MPKTTGGSSKRQVLIRLTDTEFEVLSALAYLRGVTGTEVVRAETVQLLDRIGPGARIQRLIQERREFEAEEAGQLRSLRDGKPSKRLDT
jgi:hypothetical protein